MVHDDERAQNLVLYTYLRACRSPDIISGRMSCRIWLLAILHDVITDTNPILIRARERYGQDIADVATGESSRIRFGEVAAAIGELPALDRAIILLSDMEDLSHEEIANIVRCSVGNVSFRVFRGRKFLSKRLKSCLAAEVSSLSNHRRPCLGVIEESG
jgi:RNA polymerase sigma-70 factor (ECF subfamily)